MGSMNSRETGGARDAKERIVDAAVARLHRDGLTVALDGISLEEAIADAGVARATGYRRWPNRQDFARAVLVRVVREADLVPESEDTLAAIRTAVTEVVSAAERGEIHDPGRTAVVEVLRIATEADHHRLAASHQWRDYLALRVTCEGLPDEDLRGELTAELRQAERAFAAHRGRTYARVTRALGYQVQVPGLGEDASLELMSSTLEAMMSGLIISGDGSGDSAECFTSRAFGAEVDGEWTAASYALTSSFLTFLAPPAVPAVDADLRGVLTEL